MSAIKTSSKVKPEYVFKNEGDLFIWTEMFFTRPPAQETGE